MTVNEFEKISKAIRSSYELLQQGGQPSQTALESLKEAESSLNSAIDYTLFSNGKRI